MTFRIIYSPGEHYRVIPAVLIDKRMSIPAISGAIGSVIKDYVDQRVSEVSSGFYKLETDTGCLAGYFVIGVPNDRDVIALLSLELRPQFQQFITTISTQIINFMSSGYWRFDALN